VILDEQKYIDLKRGIAFVRVKGYEPNVLLNLMT